VRRRRELGYDAPPRTITPASAPSLTPPDVRIPAAASSPQAFGDTMAALARDPTVGSRLVTAAPDVAVSTSLGGWINRAGVFAPAAGRDLGDVQRPLTWTLGPAGRHIELGISEMNLFLLLGALGLSHDHHGEQLLPVGTVYDPFVCRGLDAFIYGLYNGARFVVVGTPAGVTLAAEGGAHQSSITPSIGLELPGVTSCEPAYAQALDWLLCDGLDALTRPEGSSLYLRLSTRPLDQAPFAAAAERLGESVLRSHVLAGGYRLHEPAIDTGPLVHLAASGPVVAEAVEAARLLVAEGVAATVIDVTSLDRLYHGWRAAHTRAARTGRPARSDFHLATLVPPGERHAPIVTVHDASTHAMAWLGSVFGQRVVPVGVDEFGQSGSVDELYELFGFLPDQIVNAALVALA
jgi:pyruvate dehydrogenase E1 component